MSTWKALVLVGSLSAFGGSAFASTQALAPSNPKAEQVKKKAKKEEKKDDAKKEGDEAPKEPAPAPAPAPAPQR
jgi:hypothetical protein